VVWTPASRGANLCHVDADRSPEDSIPEWHDERLRSLVARVVGDIDSYGDNEHRTLLSDLLCAAWPSVQCQMQ